MNIPYLSLQHITSQHAEEIQQAVASVVDSGWYLQGKETAAFEREYAEFTGSKYCVSCANGLDALTMSLRACKEIGRLKDGDEVIVPANTYIATILSITENGLKAVLVEPRRDTLQINDALIEQSITPNTRAIMLVNLYGFNSFTERIGALCKAKGLMLFIDNAQGHGLDLPDCATAVCHSFYPGKNLGALGDAGAVTTNDEQLAETVRTLCNYGSSSKYVFDFQGRNSRMDELQAAVLRVKLRYLPADNERRIEIANAYKHGIRNAKIDLPKGDGVFHIFPILCEERDRLQAYLVENGIHTMIHYPIPPHLQQAYTAHPEQLIHTDLPITEAIHRQELSLPCNQAMTNDEVEYVIQTINKFL